jgi:4-amino-4-deoxy-L-arabinose transferase-like glycosyltransferase
MTSTIERPAATTPVEPWIPATLDVDAPVFTRRERIGSWFARHRLDLVWLSPLLAISAIINVLNIGGAPQRIDDEGTYVAQAWAVNNLAELAHYTYWYDHPPLGWLQLAAWTGLTNGFDRYDIAVIAGREFMIVSMLVSVVLLWAVTRRIGLSRPAAAASALLFALSPLAVQFHRTVYLDNIATPWLLASILLAMTKRNQLVGYAASAATLAVAVLSKETYLLALPLIAWLMWRGARRATRRYTISVAAAVLVMIGGSYIVFALVKGELLPSSEHTSLISGVMFQLGGRSTSGSVFDPGSLSFSTLALWFQLDPVLCILTPLAAIAGIAVRRTRPFAIALLALVLFMARPGGYVPVPYLIMLLPLAALVIAGVTDAAVRGMRRRHGLRRVPNLVWGVGVVAAASVMIPLWSSQLQGLTEAQLDAPSQEAQSWIADNVPQDSRLIVDDSMWVDLVKAGFATDDVIWFYKLDTDSAVEALNPNGWRDSDYVVTTDSMLASPNALSANEAIENSVVVASFGEGDQQVQVRRIEPAITVPATTAQDIIDQRASLGYQLTGNPGLTARTASYTTLQSGYVDERVSLLLGQLLASNTVTIGDLPLVEGEDGIVYRQVELESVGGKALVDGTELTDAGRMVESTIGNGVWAAQSVVPLDGELLVTFPITTSEGLIQ